MNDGCLKNSTRFSILQGVVVVPPPPTPALWSQDKSGCPDAFIPGTSYDAAEQVSVAVSTFTAVYECAATPANLFCGQSGYEPGTGLYWDKAWKMLGSCEGTLAPSSSPVFTSSMALVADGCPPDYDENNLADIEAGDRVSLVISATPARRVVYECKSGAFSAYCSQPAFVPGGQNTAMAWDIKGYCEGTISPTASPVSYQGNCKFTKCVISKEVCSCSHSDCPSTNGQTKGCTKEVITCSEHPVEPYSRSAHYDEGDAVVRLCM